MRMQGDDKGLVEYRGKALIEHVLDIVAPQVSDIVISANRNLPRYRGYGLPVIHDTVDGFAGPLAGIASALPTCKHEWVLVTPCDMPFLPDNLVAVLYAGRNNEPLVVAEAGGRQQLVFLIQRTMLDSINDFLLRGEYRVMSWMQSRPHRLIEFDSTSRTFSNFNTLDDLDT